jgi:hypothetical protein
VVGLAVDVELGGSAVGMVLAVGLEVLDHLGQTEEVVHLFERETLGLGDEEPDEDEHEETECSVDQEGSGDLLALPRM